MQTTKEQTLEHLENIKTAEELSSDFICLGNIQEVYPNLPNSVLECYRTWIWESKSSALRIATSDHGNSYLSYICEGIPEVLIENLPAE